ASDRRGASGVSWAAPSAPRAHDMRWLMARFILGLILLLAAVALVAQTLRSELETLGHAFVGYASYPGMAAGTLLADGFFFPVPPQFYMLLAIASNSSDAVALLSISMGSVLGGIS